MTIKYIKEDNILTIIADEINDFITNISDYTGVTLTANITCSDTNTILTANTTDIVDNTKNIYIANNILYIKPEFFSGSTAFIDGIYKFTISFNTTNGYTKINNCFFVDITFKCKLSTLLEDILMENSQNTEKIGTISHILHYALVNGSNCGCNCDEMCQVFNELKNLLLNIDVKTIEDCGC